jgi:hypothetical protein
MREARAWARSLAGPDGVGSKESMKRLVARDRINEGYEALGNELMGLARQGDLHQDSSRITAMTILGRMRFSRAVAVLAPQVTARMEGDVIMMRLLSERDFFPAAGALADIGMPAVPAMLNNLAASDDETVRERSAWVINKALLGKKAAARVFLEDAIKEAKDDQARQRLVAARKFFE